MLYGEGKITCVNKEDNTNENPETPIITVVKKPKQTLSGVSIQHPNIFWRTPRNTKDPVFASHD